MPSAEFDAVADSYIDLHRENLRLSGEEPAYFARAKIEEIGRVWRRQGRPAPRKILDFGCGVGASLPHLIETFPTAAVDGVDVSAESLVHARGRAPAARLQVYDGVDLGAAADGDYDLVFTACVFHHIPAERHVALLAQIRDRLAPSGVLAVFEHNPWNPVTRHIVATCPFDENAVLISSPELSRRLAEAGFRRPRIRYTGFFPRALRSLRPLEPWLGPAPIGAQYYALAAA